MTRPRKQSWHAPPGSEVVPGRHVIDRLGGGRRTEVYRCTDDITGEPVIVKLLRPERTGERDVRMLAREARTLAALDHPGFPVLLDSALDADPAWIVMSQVDGIPVSTVVRDQRMEAEQARPLAHDVADALAHLHDRGRVHLDVKPSNILIGSRPILLDLGAARTIERAASLSSGVGTVAWMSPEQADPDRFGPPGPAADVWGLGMVLLSATTGTNPLEARRDGDPPDEADLARACLEAAEQVPASLRDLVQACVTLQPSARPTAADVRDN